MRPDEPDALLARLLRKPRQDGDEAGIEGEMRVGRAIKAILNRDPDPVHVGRYRLGRKLGSGGMSVVYAAWDEKLDREVAIKLLRGDYTTAPGWAQRLRREALAMARLGHVNIAHVYEVGEHDGHPFIAMELIRGATLRQWLDERERSVPEIIAMYIQAARGLAAAHAAGLVHRDFKPDNVIVDEHGWARILDFGVVLAANERQPEPSDSPADAASDGHTRAGTIVGTPGYMAPEQMSAGQVDGRADQFAICVALFEALHGRRPFPGNSITQLSNSMRGRAAPPVVVADDKVPEAAAAVLARGLHPDPDARFPTMDAFIDALIDAQQHRERAQRSELERKADVLDFGVHAALRWRHSVAIGAILAAIVLVLYGLRVAGIHEAGYPDAIAFGTSLIVLQWISEWRLAKAGVNTFGQRWSRLLTVGSSIVVYSLLFAWLVGLEFNNGLAVTFLAAGSGSLAVCMFVDPRLIGSSVFLLAAAPALVLAPSLRPLWLVVSLLGAYAWQALVWGPRPRDA
jgi:predicted Ser/Thr protein kinase